MRIVMLVSSEVKQKYLVNMAHRHHELAGVIIEDRYSPDYRLRAFLKATHYNPLRIIINTWRKLLLRRFELRDARITMKYFAQNHKIVEFDRSLFLRKTKDINDAETVRLIHKLNPELVIVSGTRLVGRRIMGIAEKGTINVHTGLSPYYRGGQCAFWCLYNDEPEYIGVTVHHISPGIDSGDIILSGRPEIEPGDNVCSLECKLVILGTELLITAIGQLQEGTARRVKQTRKGKLCLSRMYTLDKRLRLERKLRQGLISRYLDRKKEVYDRVETVS